MTRPTMSLQGISRAILNEENDARDFFDYYDPDSPSDEIDDGNGNRKPHLGRLP